MWTHDTAARTWAVLPATATPMPAPAMRRTLPPSNSQCSPSWWWITLHCCLAGCPPHLLLQAGGRCALHPEAQAGEHGVLHQLHLDELASLQTCNPTSAQRQQGTSHMTASTVLGDAYIRLSKNINHPKCCGWPVYQAGSRYPLSWGRTAARAATKHSMAPPHLPHHDAEQVVHECPLGRLQLLLL